MRKKRFAALLFAWWLVVFWSIFAAAADPPRVYGDPITVQPGENITVPIRLEHNSGLMGFRITVEYPKRLRLKNLTSGSLTKEGLFNSTISDFYSVNGSFDVVWSDAQETKEDGTLMMLDFAVSDLADEGDYEIKLSFSQPDTFNEAFEPVTLQCDPVIVTVSNSVTPTTAPSSAASAETAQTGTPVSDDYLIASVDAIIQTYNVYDPAQITDTGQQDAVVQFVNNRSRAFDPDAVQYDSFDALLNDYYGAVTSEAQRKVLESVDEDVLIQSAQDVLQQYGAESFAALNEADKASAVQAMQKAIADAGGDTSGFARLSDGNAAQTLDGIVVAAKQMQADGIPVDAAPTENSGKKTAWIIGGIIAGAAVLGGAVVFGIKTIQRRKKK